jgi:hypothetical protein
MLEHDPMGHPPAGATKMVTSTLQFWTSTATALKLCSRMEPISGMMGL